LDERDGFGGGAWALVEGVRRGLPLALFFLLLRGFDEAGLLGLGNRFA